MEKILIIECMSDKRSTIDLHGFRRFRVYMNICISTSYIYIYIDMFLIVTPLSKGHLK